MQNLTQAWAGAVVQKQNPVKFAGVWKRWGSEVRGKRRAHRVVCRLRLLQRISPGAGHLGKEDGKCDVLTFPAVAMWS